MSKSTAPQHLITGSTIVGQSSKSSARNVEGVKRVNAFTIPLDKIKEMDGFNARMDSIENAEHIDQMARAFANGATPEPVRVVPITLENGEQAFKLFDGQCTTRSAHLANSKYGATITDLSARVYDISEKEQRLAISTTNRQKKLNMIENGKVYHELITLDGMTQSEVAEALGVSAPHVSNCVNAYKMPKPMKSLVAKGIMKDTEAFRMFTSKTKAKKGKKVTKEQAQRIASRISQKAIQTSRNQIATGQSRKVRMAAMDAEASVKSATPKVRIGAVERVTLTKAGTTLNEVLEGVEVAENDQVDVTLTAEQLKALKEAGLIFA